MEDIITAFVIFGLIVGTAYFIWQILATILDI
jgi:hypothetical protein